MRITEKQLQLLMQILADSVRVDITRIFSLDYDTRNRLYIAILEQQSDLIKEIGDE